MKKKELYIVEGKSAEMALKRCIDQARQSVHALQGKLLNVNKHDKKAVLANLECQQLIARLGCGFDETLKIERLSYSGIYIVMDPDIDGVHSSSLLLSFIALYYRPVVAAGQLFLIKPPQYRVSSPEQEPRYAWSETEHREILNTDNAQHEWITTRFKGIAQLSAPECFQFLVNPDSRKLFALSNE